MSPISGVYKPRASMVFTTMFAFVARSTKLLNSKNRVEVINPGETNTIIRCPGMVERRRITSSMCRSLLRFVALKRALHGVLGGHGQRLLITFVLDHVGLVVADVRTIMSSLR